jgi:hypothetical protein
MAVGQLKTINSVYRLLKDNWLLGQQAIKKNAADPDPRTVKTNN